MNAPQMRNHTEAALAFDSAPAFAAPGINFIFGKRTYCCAAQWFSAEASGVAQINRVRPEKAAITSSDSSREFMVLSVWEDYHNPGVAINAQTAEAAISTVLTLAIG